MTDTPRTDAAILDVLQSGQHYKVKADFARQLERECQKLSEEYDELWDEYKDTRALFLTMESQLGQVQNRIQPLIRENEELRRTHAGGQTGVECAELAAQNNQLRHELGEALARHFTKP